MTYTLRVWVDGMLTETLQAEREQSALDRFRTILEHWPRSEPWFVSVNAEPGPYPERSYTIARYQHVPEC